MKQDGSGLWGHAVPFLSNSENIYDESAFKAGE